MAVKKYSAFTISCILICLSFVGAQAATFTAAQTGDWNLPATWGTGIPGNADDIIIPAGITVTVPLTYNAGNLSQNMFQSITVAGNLAVTNQILLDEWAVPNDAITIKTGGKLSSVSDFSFATARASLTIEAGAELFVGGILNDGGAGITTVINNGYIEVNGDISSRQIALTNTKTGVLVAHGQVKGNGSVFTINNNGIIAADLNLDLSNVALFNHKTGQVLVFGDISITGSSTFENDGLVQCLNMTFDNLTSFSNGGTTIIQQTFTLNWGGCPCYEGDFYAGNVVVTPGHFIMPNACGTALSCGAYWTTVKKVPEKRKLWLAADFIGYGLGNDGDLIYRWFDLGNSYGFKMSESNNNFKPKLKNNAADNLNYNPVLSFSGGEKHLDLDANYMFSTAGGVAFIAVVVPESGGVANQLLMDFGDNTAAGYGFGYSTGNSYMYTPTGYGGNVLQQTGHGRASKPSVVTFKSVFGGAQNMYYDGTIAPVSNTITATTLDATTINENPAPTGSAGPVTIGGKSENPSGFDFEGKLAELMVYTKNLHDTTRISAQSYLGLKYGITLPHNYTDYNNKTIWLADAKYKYDIAGLAREDLNLLHQSIATSSNNPGELIISMGSIDGIINKKELTQRIDTNSTYLIWGHDNGILATGKRIYKITSTQFNQDVNIRFNIPGVTATPLLAIADDDSFSSSLDFTAATSHIGNQINYTYHFPKNKTVYFKLLIVSQTKGEPGIGINTVLVDSTAELHIVSTDKGILLPALANESAITSAAPPTGLLFYNTTHKRYMYNAGTPAAPQWKFIGTPLKQTGTVLLNSSGNYKGEIRYNTTDRTMYLWNGADWLQLKNN